MPTAPITPVPDEVREDGGLVDLTVPWFLPFDDCVRVGHRVGFGESRSRLVDVVSVFVGAALQDGGAAVVVATQAHRLAVEAALCASGVDLVEAAACGRYVTLDAAVALAGSMVGGRPDFELFRETVGAAIGGASRDGRRVRVYGEMLALLCERGDVAGAIRLERVWNELTLAQEFELMCAYPLLGLPDAPEDGAVGVRGVSGAHVARQPLAPEDPVTTGQQGIITSLQKQTAALRVDVARLTAEARSGRLPSSDDRSRSGEALESVLDRAERVAGVGSWEWTPRTLEARWSDNFFRLLGFEPGSIAASLQAVLDLVHPIDRDRVAATMQRVSVDGDLNASEFRIVRHDGTLLNLYTTAALAPDDGDDVRYVGSVQDVTSERRVARNLAARAAVSSALADWENFDDGAQALLSAIGASMGCCLATLWVPERHNLMPKVMWHTQTAKLQRLADAIEDLRPGRGAPTLGRAWEGHMPVLSDQPLAGASAPAAAAMRDAAIKTVIAIPAVIEHDTLAILELFSCDPIEPYDELMRSLTDVGREVGQFLSRRRGELVSAVLTPREMQVLQHAANAHGAPQIARDMMLSTATVKRHFENSYAKLGVNDRAAAIAQAMRQGLIS